MPRNTARSKQDGLIPDVETAKILNIKLKKLYYYCDRFDENSSDEWELIEGEHFEWLSKDIRKRLFYENGAMAIAKYMQEKVQENRVLGFLDNVREALTNRRKKVRQQLVKRRIYSEFATLDDATVRGELVFLGRKQIIKILATNGKGLNYAIRREQENANLSGREPMEIGVHFDTIDRETQWSQRGVARIAQNMAENLQQKSRRAWVDAVYEIVQDAVREQKLFLEGSKARVARTMKQAKEAARNTCQVTLKQRTAANPFNLAAHHLFDKSSRPDIADELSNLLVMQEEIHIGFHRCHGSKACEPSDFIDYITSVEIERFSTQKQQKHLTALVNRLERIQKTYGSKS